MWGSRGRPGLVSNAISWAVRIACAVRVILFGNETGEFVEGVRLGFGAD
jgi:hypothetical protein